MREEIITMAAAIFAVDAVDGQSNGHVEEPVEIALEQMHQTKSVPNYCGTCFHMSNFKSHQTLSALICIQCRWANPIGNLNHFCALQFLFVDQF